MRRTCLGLFALLACTPAAVRAQDARLPTWGITLGAGVFAGPKYVGSDETWVLPIPIVGVEYKGRVFLGAASGSIGAGAGVKLLRGPKLNWTVGLGGSDSRPSDRADALAGMEDHGLGFAGVSALSYRAGPLELSTTVGRGFNQGTGWSGSAHLGLTVPLGRRVFVSLGGGAGFADRQSMAYDFGVSGGEAARRSVLLANGDPRLRPGDDQVYRPDGGLRDLSTDASLAVMLGPRWSLFGFGGLSRLSAEAAASPLVRRRNQWNTGVGVSYRP